MFVVILTFGGKDVVAILECLVAWIADSFDPGNVRWEPEVVLKIGIGVGSSVEVWLGGFSVADVCKIYSEALP